MASYLGKDEDGNAMYTEDYELPTITFNGTVKIHGTNGGVILRDDIIYPQSRDRLLSLMEDNKGFASFVLEQEWAFKAIFEDIKERIGSISYDSIIIYGEWAGGSVQKGIGLSKLPKLFYIIGVKLKHDDGTPSTWVNIDGLRSEGCKIYNIRDFEQFNITINFNNIAKARASLKAMQDYVEYRCPVAAKLLRIEGELIGEGIVFQGEYQGNPLSFKVKGEKHSKGRSKGPRVYTEEELATMSAVKACATKLFTYSRCNQALDELFAENEPLEIKQIGPYLKWMGKDHNKELANIIAKDYKLEVKSVVKELNHMAKKYFMRCLGDVEC